MSGQDDADPFVHCTYPDCGRPSAEGRAVRRSECQCARASTTTLDGSEDLYQALLNMLVGHQPSDVINALGSALACAILQDAGTLDQAVAQARHIGSSIAEEISHNWATEKPRVEALKQHSDSATQKLRKRGLS